MQWLNELEALVARFGCAVEGDLAEMSFAQLWALYAFLRARAERG